MDEQEKRLKEIKAEITNLGDVSLDELSFNTEVKENLSFKEVLEKIKGEKKK